MKFEHYQTGPFFDEMFEADGQPRPAYRALLARLLDLPVEDLRRRQREADATRPPASQPGDQRDGVQSSRRHVGDSVHHAAAALRRVEL